MTPAELDALLERLDSGDVDDKDASDAAAAIRELRARVEAAQEATWRETELLDSTWNRCQEAERERDALRADAERYRWLRDHSRWGQKHRLEWYLPMRETSLDAAIDEARKL